LNTDSGEKNLADSTAPIRTIGVLGAGTMGHGIAQMAAMAGFEVLLRDVDEVSLARGRQAIERNLAKGVQLGKVSAEDREEALARIHSTVEMGDLKAADLIVEAAPENLDLKQSLLRESEDLTALHCIWASNTFKPEKSGDCILK